MKENELIKFDSKEKEYLKMLHTNTGIFFTQDSDKYFFYISKKNFVDKNIEDYQNIKNHFKLYKDELIQKKINYKTPDRPYFYLHRERDESLFKEEGRKFTYTEKSFYGTANLFFIKSNRVDLKFIPPQMSRQFSLKSNSFTTIYPILQLYLFFDSFYRLFLSSHNKHTWNGNLNSYKEFKQF